MTIAYSEHNDGTGVSPCEVAEVPQVVVVYEAPPSEPEEDTDAMAYPNGQTERDGVRQVPPDTSNTKCVRPAECVNNPTPKARLPPGGDASPPGLAEEYAEPGGFRATTQRIGTNP